MTLNSKIKLTNASKASDKNKNSRLHFWKEAAEDSQKVPSGDHHWTFI